MDNTTYMMIDIETTGTTPGCNILSIGITTFNVNPGQRQDRHFTIRWDPFSQDFSNEVDTMKWWRSQNQEVAKEAFSGTASYLDTLTSLSDFIAQQRKGNRAFRIYSKGAAFDFPILEYAYKAVGLPIPWQYYERQCYATLKNHCPRISEPTFIGIRHNALADAIHQARHCEEILKFLA